jgi:Histidine kinase-, DNA gyrase B-, and HSP90-like ATPase
MSSHASLTELRSYIMERGLKAPTTTRLNGLQCPAMGETRVDLLHLLEDLRDAYPGSLEETILTEIVANSLDSGACRIKIETDPAQAALTVIDDGSGMRRQELARYHDIAASAKSRGEGIGFAGVGIKLGLLVCEEVLTETRRASSHVASLWHLASRHKAPWKWVNPVPGMIAEDGTAVRLKLRNPLSPLLDAGFLEAALRRNFEPLLDPSFDSILLPLYERDIHFEINGRRIERFTLAGSERSPSEIRLGRKRKPSAVGVLIREPNGLPEDQRGIAISTYGKVIKRGWDWLGVTPLSPETIGGAFEAPELAGCLTLNKGDFIRSGVRGATYIAYRRAIQAVVSRQLAEWGNATDVAGDSRRRVARPLERDLENVLVDLADDFPMLASLVEHRLGGQRKLPMYRAGGASDAHSVIAASIAAAAEGSGSGSSSRPSVSSETQHTGVVQTGESTDHAAQQAAGGLPSTPGNRRPARYGLAVQFESRTGELELARLVESTVLINEAHPAFRRAVASRSEGYHLAVAVAMALSPLAVQPAEEHGFITAFLSRWGELLEGTTSRRRAGR